MIRFADYTLHSIKEMIKKHNYSTELQATEKRIGTELNRTYRFSLLFGAEMQRKQKEFLKLLDEYM